MKILQRFKISRLTTLGLLILITSCGWHLRGSQEITNVSAVHITAKNPETGLALTLEHNLKRLGVKLVSKATEASHNIVLIDQDETKRVLSLDGAGRASEYLLVREVEFIILDGNGEPLVEKQTTETQRIYDHDDRKPLAKSNEETLLQDEMYQTLSDNIIRILANSGP